MSDENYNSKETKRYHGGVPESDTKEGPEQKIRRLEEELVQARKRAEEAAEAQKRAEENAAEERKKAKEAAEAQKRAQENAAEMTALLEGRYYASFHNVWKKGWLSYHQGGSEMKFMRRKVPSVNLPVTKLTNEKVYELTLLEACKDDTVVKDDGQSARTSHSNTEIREDIWPCHVLESDLEPQMDENHQESKIETETETADVNSNVGGPPESLLMNMQRRGNFLAPDSDIQELVRKEEDMPSNRPIKVSGQIAHLVPASPLHASLYYNVAKCVFALGRNIPEELIQKLIHGCTPNMHMKDRITGVGLKHFASNKLRLCGQAEHYDQHANVLIVPILTTDQVREWNGNGYEALFMIGRKDGEHDMKNIASSTQFLDKGPTADEAEIQRARVLLTDAIQFLMQSLWAKQPNCLTTNHTELLEIYKSYVSQPDGTKQVVFPKQRNTEEVRPVRKIRFGPQTGIITSGSNKLHPAPDPLLLVVKAAVNWSKAHNQQLLAGGEYDSDGDVSTLSGIAEQMHYEACQTERRKVMDKEVSGMTIGI
jgi:hypothetical protein